MPDLTPDFGALASELRMEAWRLTRRLRARRGHEDLPERCISVMFALSSHGPMAPSALAERERVRPPSMTRTIAALSAMGLVSRAAHPLDGRQVVVSLTEKGRATLAETIRRRDQWLAERLETLSPAERADLERAVAIIGRLID